jgi:signal transduction histidine kinase
MTRPLATLRRLVSVGRSHVAGVRGRTVLAAVAVVGVALTAGAALLVKAEDRALTNDIETTAVLRATVVAGALADGTVPEDLTVAQGDEGVVQVVDDSGRVVAASTNVEGKAPISSLVAPVHGHSARTSSDVPVGDTDFRIVAVRASVNGRAYTVYVASSLEPVDDSTDALERLLALGLPVLVLLVGWVAWLVVGKALGPVEAIRSEVEAISERDLHRRVSEPPTGDEIGRLARTMNVMLGRLEDSALRHQRFVADASHELRSPLTSMRAQLEVELAHPERSSWTVTGQEVLSETVRLQRLVDDLLALARSDHAAVTLTRSPVDLDDVVLREVRRLRSSSTMSFDVVQVSGGQVLGDVDQLTRVVRNVLDNAARHARSSVAVALAETGTEVTLVVEDDGPGIPADAVDRVFDRFARLDEARARDDGGTGLGLAITKEIVTAHQGTIEVSDAAPGARFVVRLPIAPAVYR